MNRAQKVKAVEELHQMFESSELVVITHYSGLNVAEISELRAKMRESGASFKVTKNTLAKRAVEGTRFSGLADQFSGPTGMATSQDPVAAARVAYEYAKENDKLVILGGALGEQILDSASVEALAKLPSLDELRSKLVGLLVAPATRVATVLQAPASQLARVTRAYADKG
ncbi:MAG: 50S ribosomal protein L10 [Micavibrio sp.]|nr:MAG: 50S ribosomal protein L10 [Micavibrio sp.]